MLRSSLWVYPAEFNFNTDTLPTGSTKITKEGLSLTLANENMLDTDGGFVRVDKDNGIDFSGTIQRPSSGFPSYTIRTWVYLYEEVYETVLFWLPLLGDFGSPLAELSSICWGSIISDGSSKTYVFSCKSGSKTFSYEYFDTSNPRSTWQYYSFSFKAYNSASGGYGPASSTDLKVWFYDSSGGANFESMTPSSSNQRFTTIPSIGRFQNVSMGEYYYPLIGLYYYISIFNTWEGWSPTSRSNYISLHKDSYFLHFKLDDADQNTYFENKIQK